jgi:hypothetical protein
MIGELFKGGLFDQPLIAELDGRELTLANQTPNGFGVDVELPTDLFHAGVGF